MCVPKTVGHMVALVRYPDISSVENHLMVIQSVPIITKSLSALQHAALKYQYSLPTNALQAGKRRGLCGIGLSVPWWLFLGYSVLVRHTVSPQVVLWHNAGTKAGIKSPRPELQGVRCLFSLCVCLC